MQYVIIAIGIVVIFLLIRFLVKPNSFKKVKLEVSKFFIFEAETHSPTLSETIEKIKKADPEAFEDAKSKMIKKTVALKSGSKEALENSVDFNAGRPITEKPRTGFKYLDEAFEGFRPGTLTVLSGGASCGKTSFALGVALNVSVKQKLQVVFFSLESTGENLVEKIIAMASWIKGKKMNNGLLTDDEMEKITKSVSELAKAPLFIDDTAGLTVEQIEETLENFKDESRGGLVLIDYMQLLETRKDFSDAQSKATYIIHELKRVSKKLNVAILLISQVGRIHLIRGGIPRLSDLDEFSPAISQDADAVLFLHPNDHWKPKDEQSGVVDVIILKDRYGDNSETELYFDRGQGNFLTIEKTTFEDFQ